MPQPIAVAVVGLLSSLVLSCASRQPELECRNELDWPGDCPPVNSPAAPPLEVTPGPASNAGQLDGREVDLSGAAIRHAEVQALGPLDTRVTTDSSGRYRLTVPVGTEVVLQTSMIGYRRRIDTLQVPEGAGLSVKIALHPTPMDGPCSGFQLVCKPRIKGSE